MLSFDFYPSKWYHKNGSTYENFLRAPVVKGISRRPPEPEVGVRIPAGVPHQTRLLSLQEALGFFYFTKTFI